MLAINFIRMLCNFPLVISVSFPIHHLEKGTLLGVLTACNGVHNFINAFQIFSNLSITIDTFTLQLQITFRTAL